MRDDPCVTVAYAVVHVLPRASSRLFARRRAKLLATPVCDPGAPCPGSLSLPRSKGALLLSHTFRSLSRDSGRVLKFAQQSHRSPRPATLPLSPLRQRQMPSIFRTDAKDNIAHASRVVKGFDEFSEISSPPGWRCLITPFLHPIYPSHRTRDLHLSYRREGEYSICLRAMSREK